MILPGLSGGIHQAAGGGANPVPVVTFGGSYISAANASVYTSPSIAIGEATGVRSVIVGLRTTSSRTAVRVGGSGGVDLTHIAGASGVEFWGGLVATGTTATIYTEGSATDRISLGVWHAQNVLDPTTATDVLALPNGTNSGTLDVAEGGFIIATGITYSNIGNLTFTDITNDFSTAEIEASQRGHGGSLDNLSAVTGRTVAFTVSGGANWSLRAIAMR